MHDRSIAHADLVAEARRTGGGRAVIECEDEEDDTGAPSGRGVTSSRAEGLANSAFAELRTRPDHCGAGWHRYPFVISEDDQLVAASASLDHRDQALLYLFLLLASNLDMRCDRRHGGLDGTEVFERVCAQVGGAYLGGRRVSSEVFGTARRTGVDGQQHGRFVEAVNSLTSRFGEGIEFRQRTNSYQVNAKDGGVDVVVWRPFTDGLPGKLSGFGQCKTGRSWEPALESLQPDSFCDRFWRERPAVMPVRMFFVADRLPFQQRREAVYDLTRRGGILFDRCRILDTAPQLPASLQGEVAAWTMAALQSKGLQWP